MSHRLRSTTRSSRAALSICLCGALAVGTAVTAQADPKPVFPSQKQVDAAKKAVGDKAHQVSDLEAKYTASQATLEEVQVRAADAAEKFNGAQYELELRTRAADEARKRAALAQKQADSASLRVRQYAASVYQQGGGLGSLEALVNSRGPQDLLDRAAALDAVGEVNQRTLRTASATSVTANALRRQAALAEAQQIAAAQRAQEARNAAQAEADAAQAEATRIGQEQEQMAAQLATLRDTSVQIEKDRQEGMRAAEEARKAAEEAARQARIAAAKAAAAAAKARREKAARAAAEEAAREQRAAEAAAREAAEQARAAEAAAKAAAKRKRGQPAPQAPRAPSTSHLGVIGFAQAQLGEWYVWGADGPDTWDCSGLTMMAWRQAGVYLTHYTGAQYAETRHYPVSQRRPGDLIFFGSSVPTIHHVGLYVGNGMMIEAPHTGAQVRYSSIWRSDLIANVGRP